MQSTNQIINPYCQSTYAMRIDYEPKAADSCRMKEIFTCCRHVLDLTSINTKQTLNGLMQDSPTESLYKNPMRAINNWNLSPRLNCSNPCHQMETRCLQQGHFNTDVTCNKASKPNLCSPWLDLCSAKQTVCNTNSMTACVLQNSNQQSSK